MPALHRLLLPFALLGCGASTGARDDLPGPDAGAVPSCLPPCLAQALGPCGPPSGACVAYITAAPDNWRRCFANGLRVEAQPMGGHQFRRGTTVCARVSSLGAATVTVDTFTTPTGAPLGTITRPAGNRGPWTVTCDGASYAIDPASPACAADPWVRGYNPHGLPCPLDTEACRDR